MKTKVVKKRVAKEESYTVFQRVPVTQKYEKETCYLENGVKTQTITQKKCHRVKNPVTRTYSVQVPVEEFQEGVASCDDCTAGGQGGSGAACTCKTRMRKETRTAQCEVDDVVFETITKEISYCVKVPKKHKEICAEETIYKLQPVQKTRTVEVCVPEIIKVPVETCVTKMVPKTIHCCERCAKHH